MIAALLKESLGQQATLVETTERNASMIQVIQFCPQHVQRHLGCWAGNECRCRQLGAASAPLNECLFPAKTFTME